jgi:Protein of unknown function (DUF3054)
MRAAETGPAGTEPAGAGARPAGTGPAGTGPAGSRLVAGSAAADLACTLLFVVIGRANHHAGESPAGLWDTFWPFAAGTVAGLAAVRFWRRPAAVRPTGVAVWLGTVVIGMILRVLAGQGTAVAFILVALAFLGLFQLGWRAAWHRLGPARRHARG